jgi:hypothetical protein
MATPNLYLSPEAQIALTKFSTEFSEAFALGEFSNWARQFGLVDSNKYRTMFPIPVSSAGYELRQGDDRMRDLFEKSINFTPVEWEDGVKAKRSVIEAPDFIGWIGEPGRIATEGNRNPNVLIASMLESNSGAGPVLQFDGLSLFNDAHPCNVFNSGVGVFDNNRSAVAFDAAMVAGVFNYFRSIKGPNGKFAGRRPTHILVPGSMEQTAAAFFSSESMYNAILVGAGNTNLQTNNLYGGSKPKFKIEVVVADELTTAGVCYFIDANGPKPWVIQDGGAPEEIVYDMNSELYKANGFLGLKFILTQGVGAALAQSICRMHIGGSE